MFARRFVPLLLVLFVLSVLSGCATAGSKLSDSFAQNAFSNDSLQQPAGGVRSGSESGDSLPALPTSAAPPAEKLEAGDHAAQAGPVGQTDLSGQTPLIIKQAEIRLQVKDTDQAIDRLTQIVGDTGGYIVSNRVWFQQAGEESYKYATYTIGVPVDAFEVALRRLRAMALKVVDETASGQDVSEEYVDLESRLRNLEATRDRIRGFLDQAQTVEESLRINNELAAIEEQIEQVQGRMRYLAGRAAFSTITVQLDPELPELPAKPTPTPTPTPVPYIWDPGRTFERASGAAVKFGQVLVDMFIYVAVWVPFALPALIVWIVYKIVTHKRNVPQP